MADAPPPPSSTQPQIDPNGLRELLRIAGPTVATMVSFTLMTFTDKWLCSHIGPEPIYVGAQGNGGLSSWVAISLGHGLLMILSTFVSQNFGAGKAHRGPAYVWNGLWVGLLYWLFVLLPLAFAMPAVFDALASKPGETSGMDPRQAVMSGQYASVLLFGACFTLATRSFGQFFYGLHRPRVVMIAGITANIFNLLVSGVLVFGNGPIAHELGFFGKLCHAIATPLGIEPMGVRGSAIGTVLATIVELAIPLSVFLGKEMHTLYQTRSAWRWSGSHVKEIFKLGWPAGAMMANEMICWGFFMVYLVSGFGAHATNAAWYAHQYMSLSFMPAVGLSVATSALVGKYQGMGRSDLAAARAWLATRIAVAYMGVCAAIFVFLPETLLNVFIDNDTAPEDKAQLIALGTKFLYATAAFQLFDAIAMVLSGALRGAGDTLVPGIATLVSSWVIIVGGGFAMVHFFEQLGPLGPWIASATYIAVLCIFLLGRFVSGRWKSIKVVHDGTQVHA